MNGWPAIIAFMGGFVVAQLWKFIAGLMTGAVRGKKRSATEMIEYLTRSGGMPSGHAASMTAVATYIGCSAGVGSEVFALALAMTLVVIYDAIHVRYAVGEQGDALNKLLKAAKKPTLPLIEGHTPAQAAVGTVLGIIIGLAVFAILA